MFAKRLIQTSLASSRQSQTLLKAGARGFARSQSGMQDYKFDYFFEAKVDHGNFPHPFASYMKTLGDNYDTQSSEHLENLEQMTQLNMELDNIMEDTCAIS